MGIRVILAALSPGTKITLDDIDENDVATDPANALIDVTFSSDGNIYKTEGVVGPTDIGDWLTPQNLMSLFSIKATLNSGTLHSGTTGSWLALTSDRSWQGQQTTVGTNTCDLTIEIAYTADTSIVLDSCNLLLTATVLTP